MNDGKGSAKRYAQQGEAGHEQAAAPPFQGDRLRWQIIGSACDPNAAEQAYETKNPNHRSLGLA
jgi:hypothetical protein